MRKKKPVIGLALGAGGLRGMAHIGVLKVLRRAGIEPDMVAGTSSGSVIAGLLAYGTSLEEMEELATSIKGRRIFEFRMSLKTLFQMLLKIILDGLQVSVERFKEVPAGFIEGYGLEQLIFDLTAGCGFSKLKIPCAVLATDIDSGETVVFIAEEHIPRKDPPRRTVFIVDAALSQAVRASTAIPGIFVPKKVRGRTLVDGGVKDYVPAEMLKWMGADIVIAVDLGYAGKRKEPVDNVLEVAIQASDIMGRELTDIKLERFADVRIKPRIYDVGLFQFSRIPECIARGEEAAELALPEIWKAIEGWRTSVV